MVCGAQQRFGVEQVAEGSGHAGIDTVPLGEVVFVPDLPRMITAADALVVGKVVTSSDQAASLLRATPTLSVDAPKEASLALTEGMKVDVEIGRRRSPPKFRSRRRTPKLGFVSNSTEPLMAVEIGAVPSQWELRRHGEVWHESLRRVRHDCADRCVAHRVPARVPQWYLVTGAPRR